MDHVTTILERAERDGAIRRLVTTTAPPQTVRPDQTSSAVTAPEIPISKAHEATPVQSHIRTVAARLDPLVVTGTAPDSLASERYRALRTRVLHANSGSVRVLLVTSPIKGEGKSVTAANLALSLAQGHERRVCIVDANLRSPRIDRLFGLPRLPGLAEVLAAGMRLDDALVRLEGSGLTILPGGTPPARPAELLVTSAMRRTIDELRSRFDFVVIDTPAIQPLADVGSLAPLADSVLLVARTGVTSKASIREAASAMGNTAILGIVLNETA